MTLSGIILITCCVILAIWDMYVAIVYGVDYTISRFIQQTGYNYPSLILAMGILIGHFFAAMTSVIQQN